MIFAGSGPNRSGQLASGRPTTPISVPAPASAYLLTKKTVLRGGSAFSMKPPATADAAAPWAQTVRSRRSADGQISSPFQWDGGIPKPAGYQPPPFLSPSYGNGYAVDYLGPTFGKAPRIHNWSFNVQREIGKFLIDVDYSGNRGNRLNSTVDLNQVNPSYLYLGPLLSKSITAPAVVAAGFTSCLTRTSTGSLAQVAAALPAVPECLVAQQRTGTDMVRLGTFKVERRLGNWQFTASYVRSKSLGLLTYRQIFSQNQVYPQDMYNLNKGKIYLPFDQPNVFNFLSSYRLPFGTDKQFFGNSNRWLITVIGNWTIADYSSISQRCVCSRSLAPTHWATAFCSRTPGCATPTADNC